MAAQPVRDLQRMLTQISFSHPQIPQVIPDGIFGERTLEAVMVFQRDFHPPVTGVVDLDTWQAITRLYQKSVRDIGTPPALRVMRNGRDTVQGGGQTPPAPIMQAMFDALSAPLKNFKATAVPGASQIQSAENTRELQRVCGLDETGVMDRATWEGLARLYQLFITRENTP